MVSMAGVSKSSTPPFCMANLRMRRLRGVSRAKLNARQMAMSEHLKAAFISLRASFVISICFLVASIVMVF